MAWVEPRFSRREVNRAGETLRSSTDEQELRRAREVLKDWRSAHGYPLNALSMTLKNRARKAAGPHLISKRLKRLRSVESKLHRISWLGASQIQDLGGARIVLPSTEALHRLRIQYEKKEGRGVFSLHKASDYIAQPKADGYRSLHFIYKYSGGKKPAYADMRIELQIRTQQQHAWATAVEAASFFMSCDLKAGEGPPAWLEFFRLASHWMASEEGCPGVPGIPDGPDYLFSMWMLWRDLGVEALLHGWQKSVRGIGSAPDDEEIYLLHLDTTDRLIDLKAYGRNEEEFAADEYALLEEEFGARSDHHVVLVGAGDVKQLRRAYPGFYADTGAFLDSVGRGVDQAMEGKWR